MKTIHLALAAAAIVSGAVLSHGAAADTFGSGASTFEIEFVTVDDPGNAADTSGKPNPAGAVDYVYRIGKYEVSREMVAKANASGDLQIELNDVSFITGGARPDMPAFGVSWNEAARFVNWMNTSRGFPEAYRFSTHPGEAGYDSNVNIDLWEAGDPGFDVDNPYRNSTARYFLPSADEWYKAAFYDPHANSATGGYWQYPTGSNSEPVVIASGTDPGTAVYRQPKEQGPADITRAGGLSPYGAMAMGGNVYEWEETATFLINDDGSHFRGVRLGKWTSGAAFLLSVVGRSKVFNPDFKETGFGIGFRVASVPEPSSQLIAALAMIGLLVWQRK